jgi:hypothetical protein
MNLCTMEHAENADLAGKLVQFVHSGGHNFVFGRKVGFAGWEIAPNPSYLFGLIGRQFILSLVIANRCGLVIAAERLGGRPDSA